MGILKSIHKQTSLRLIAILLTISQAMAHGKPEPGATTPPANATHMPNACDALGKVTFPGAHTVTLSWKEGVPGSALLHDAVIGYMVYRSAKPHDSSALPMNIGPMTDTACVDTHVAPGETYYYVTRAVSASGVISGPSNEVRVQIPH